LTRSTYVARSSLEGVVEGHERDDDVVAAREEAP
jgi:hypothetical protein